MILPDIKIENLRLVIFDLDGTLYRAKPLRRIMMRKLALYYLRWPWKYKELIILGSFRKQREKLAFKVDEDIITSQYRIPAAMVGVEPAVVEKIVSRWMYEEPLPHLKKNVFPAVYDLFKILHERKVKIAILSDYPAEKKLKTLNLKADLVVSATDEHINCLKPGSKGLSFILNYFNTKPEECVFIGDRTELDGKCAGRLNIPFFLVKNNHDYEKLIGLFS